MIDGVGWNDALRFLLEVGALVGLAAWGWSMGRGPWRWVLAILLPLVGVFLWGTFRVPGDPGPARVAVPGWTRLIIEAAVFGGGAVGLGVAFGAWPGAIYAALVLFHYLMSLERVGWLLQQ